MAIDYPTKQLSLIKPGQSAWASVGTTSASDFYRYEDVACFSGRIYALCGVGDLVLLKMDDDGPPRATYVAPPPNPQWAWEHMYLLDSSGGLLMVQQFECVSTYDYWHELVRFEVHKFDFDEKEWTKLEGLGDRAIFVGGHHSMSICASSFKNCKSNRIYFAGDGVEQWWHYNLDPQEPLDTGVYNMAGGSVEAFNYGPDYSSYYSCSV